MYSIIDTAAVSDSHHRPGANQRLIGCRLLLQLAVQWLGKTAIRDKNIWERERKRRWTCSVNEQAVNTAKCEKPQELSIRDASQKDTTSDCCEGDNQFSNKASHASNIHLSLLTDRSENTAAEDGYDPATSGLWACTLPLHHSSLHKRNHTKSHLPKHSPWALEEKYHLWIISTRRYHSIPFLSKMWKEEEKQKRQVTLSFILQLWKSRAWVLQMSASPVVQELAEEG